ncbi:Carboxyl-terminal-processing peptidase 3 chloroplastic [Zea mays]|uniref:Carboxyl-terminal-processing peptidase 3 chloroplastic n=1 Tax=Zea mays TaxID=4577 RepID=A0A1D6NZN4_MAIZE|nr:Carboxyl-terminal-processing peptidase 3 chloroplastic [Zea mays]
MEMVECSLVATLAPRPLPGQVRKALPRPAAFGARARLRVRSVGREEPLHPQQTAVRASGPDHGGRALGQAAVGFAAAAVVSLTGFSGDVSPLPTPPARAESLTVAFPVSKARECPDWDQKLQQTMVEIFPLKSADAAYSKISGMLSTLGDPFTRIISPKEYQSFRIGSDGNVQGVGVFINKEPSSGRLGGPADRAGIHEGDELVEIDGKSVSGLDGEAAAQRLRGRVGTTVKVKLLDGTDDERGGGLRQKEVQLSREIINLSPLSTAIISHRTDDGHECKTGYVRLASFYQGGLVKAGLDVAQIWLDGDETLVNTIDREGNVLPINMIQGHSLTHDPLVVLVYGTCQKEPQYYTDMLNMSMKEAQVQVKSWQGHYMTMDELFWLAIEPLSVTELDDGSALFITVAKYLSPALHEIDQVGIQPDIQCSPDILSLPRAPSLRENSNATNLEMDSCIMVAEQALEIQQSKGSAS